MKKVWVGLLLWLALCRLSIAQNTQHSVAEDPGYSNATLSFRYMPPSEMRDKTQRFRAEIQQRAVASHSKDTLDALLAMSSGPDDKATDWHSLTIETYPRKVVADLDEGGTDRPRVGGPPGSISDVSSPISEARRFGGAELHFPVQGQRGRGKANAERRGALSER
jgi:hypothetical protein